MLANTAPSGPTGGFYFAENGSFSWKTLSQAILKHTKLDTTLETPDDEGVKKIGEILGCSPAWVPISMAGRFVSSSSAYFLIAERESGDFPQFEPARRQCP